MRTIKFRALSMCRGEHWVYGDLRHYNRNPHTEKWTIHVPETGLETDVDETTIGQFTGLMDKNGKEMYEGDIIRHSPNSDIYYIVEWHICELVAKQIGASSYAGIAYWLDVTEVIGNIHDNPELLKCNINNIK